VQVEDLKIDILRVSKWSGDRGWCPGTSGNISVFDEERGVVHMKVSEKNMADLKPSDIVTVNLDGELLDGNGKPSKEVNFHLGLYKSRKDVKAVLHTHPPFATGYAVVGREIPKVVVTAKIILKKVPVVDYATPGSLELANLVVKSFEDPAVKSALLKDHGVVSIGEDVYRAFYIMDYVENAAKMAVLSSVIRGLPL